MTLSLNPIGPWPLVAAAAAIVVALTLWAYQMRLKGTTGRWRWVALGLRLAAVAMCLLAALRPSIVTNEKKKQAASLILMADRSTSMGITDGVGGGRRYDDELKTLNEAIKAAESLKPDLDIKTYTFDSALREYKAEDTSPPTGGETALGTALDEAIKRQAGTRVASIVVLTDAANNSGLPPLSVAERLKAQQIPVIGVGFGTDTAGINSRDIAARDIAAGPQVFVKNEIEIRGTLTVRGFANQTIDIEALVEGEPAPIRTQVKVPEGSETVPVSGLKYIPQTPGEKRVTLRAKPVAGELVPTNNEVSTYLNVLKGGINVRYLQGPNFTWDCRYLYQSLASSKDIHLEYKIVSQPSQGGSAAIEDSEFAPGKYDVYILGDMPANFLTAAQQRMLRTLVEQRGAGLMMLGGRSSFGAGGWAATEVAQIVPVALHPGDGQNDPKGGIKVIPNAMGLDSFVLRLSPDRNESARIWADLPPIPGANRLGEPKRNALVFAQTPEKEILMAGMEPGKGRVLAFAGETWIWARATDEGRLAHRKFWRQAILWLSHKEDQGENQIKLDLDRRRISLGQKLDLTVTARDAKNEPIPGIQFETTITPEVAPEATGPATSEPGKAAAPAKAEAPPKSETVPLYQQNDEARGSYYASAEPGEYRVTVKATRDGKEVGRDTARFLIYQDDREMENPAADLGLLRQVAETTGGTLLPPERLARHIREMKKDEFTQYVAMTERRLWDNWPFLMIFLTLLTAEWYLRKRNGWV